MKPNVQEIHDFNECLEYSEAPAQYADYMKAVAHWFPKEKIWARVTEIEQQKKGNDLTLKSSDGKEINIQFKSRTVDYGDILIEYRHDFPSGYQKPGWIEVESNADFLLYFMPTRVFKIDYKKLHAAWKMRKDIWKKTRRPVLAKNKEYTTVSLTVSVFTLRDSDVDIEVFELDGSDNRPSTQIKEHGDYGHF